MENAMPISRPTMNTEFGSKKSAKGAKVVKMSRGKSTKKSGKRKSS
jgi:hypothetical protein